MRKELSLLKTPISTYQSNSFISYILYSYDNSLNAYHNNYINIECRARELVTLKGNIHLEYIDCLWDSFCKQGIAEMDLYYIRNIAEEKMVDFLKERIDQNNYLLLYDIDEFYLPYSEKYMKSHFIHDTYIYGYDEDEFLVLAYSNRKLQKIKVAKDDIKRALYRTFPDGQDTSFCTFRINASIYIEPDQEKIRRGLRSYLHSNNDNMQENTVYGLDTYESVLAYLSLVKSNISTMQKIDMRIFKFLYEHKSVMKQHVIYWTDKKPESELIVNNAKEIENLASTVFLSMLKYSVTTNVNLIDSSIDFIGRMKIIEKKMIESVLDVL